jgi:Sulfotransferase family
MQTTADFAAPVLVHIGYHKTGTKWLRAALFEDPSTGYGLISKETRPVRSLVRDRPLDFDPVRTRSRLDPLIDEARAAGLVPVVCWGRLAGHAYSGGYDCKEIASRLKAVLPDARILVVIREQRGVILSTYKQYVRSGGVCSVEHFLHPATDRGWRVPGFELGYFDYDRLIRHYQSLYGRDSVLAIPYEQLVEDRGAFIARIAEFADRPVSDEIVEQARALIPANTAKTALNLAVRRGLNQLGPRTEINPAPLLESKRLSRVGTNLRKKVKLPHSRALDALGNRSEARLRRAVSEAVGDHYVESNRVTSELIGLDLASYGWML